MKDYTVRVTLDIPITAKNEAQAQERADKMLDATEIYPGKEYPTWASGDNIEREVVVNEE